MAFYRKKIDKERETLEIESSFKSFANLLGMFFIVDGCFNKNGIQLYQLFYNLLYYDCINTYVSQCKMTHTLSF